MPEPGTLIKIGRKEHIECLYDDGFLYMNNLPYFWKVEDEEIRGDPHDGIATLHRGTKATVKKDGVELPITVIAWDLRLHPDNADEINIFSMYALRPSTTPIDDRVLKFGDTALILTQPQEFMNRILAVLKDQDIHGEAELVTYVPDDYTGEVGPFRKLQRFSWQAEWRITTYRGPKGPRTLSVGCLHDIAVVYPTTELNAVITTGTMTP